MNKYQLRELIRDILKYLEPEIPYSEVAVELLMLTAAKESELGMYIKQLGKGPALGIFQMEPRTENCMWTNWLRWRQPLARKISMLADEANMSPFKPLYVNLAYQTAMARAHYYRAPFKMVTHLHTRWMANIWKKHYNTIHGAGTEQQAINAYNRLCV